MLFPLYREYNEDPFAILECLEYNDHSGLLDLYNKCNGGVTIDNVRYSFGWTTPSGFANRPNDGYPAPSAEFIDSVSQSGWLLPDPSDNEISIFLDGGTQILFRYFQENGENKIQIRPPIKFRHEEDYFDGVYDGSDYLVNANLGSTQSIGAVTLHIFHCNRHRYRTYDSWEPSAPAYTMFVRIRSRSGSLGDAIYLCSFSDEMLTISDGEKKAPNAPNKTTRRGGMGTGSYPNRVNGERMNVAIRNASTSYGGNGDGLTYYRLTKSALHAVLNKVFQIGIARDNAYLRQCLVSAYLLPDVTIAADTGYGVSVANERIPVGQVEIYDIEHISQPRNAHYDFINNEDYSVGWDNYTDFTNTKLTLYLPFVGSINIDVNACQYSRLSVTYYIDVYNGNIVYWVYTRSYDSPTDTLYGVYSGNCAIQIPLYGVGESGSILGKVTNMVNAVATGAAAAITGNPRMAVKAVGDTMSTIESAIPTYTVERNGTIDTNSVSLQGWRISLKISKPKVLRCDSVQLIGLPSYYKARISELPSGYHVVSAVDVDTIPNATAAEKEEIRRVLMGGFYK